MEDSKSKLLKLMWVPETKEIVWDMQTEKAISADNDVYAEINSVFNLEDWGNEFELLYSSWLEEDNNDLYDISNSFYQTTLSNLDIINKNPKSFNLYLWFDVDRSLNENFQWETCPVTNTSLVRLNENTHYLNRLISKEKYLVFPDMKVLEKSVTLLH